jgi:chromosome segregation protein
MAQSNLLIKLQSAGELERRVKNTIDELLDEKAAKEAERDSIQEQLNRMEGPEGNSLDALAKKEKDKAALEEELTRIQEMRLLESREAEALETRRSGADQELYSKQMQKHEADIRLAKFDTQMEALKEKLWEEFEMSYVQAMEFEAQEFVMSRALKESREIKDRMRELGDVNIGAIKEFEQVSQRYTFLRTQKEDLLKAIGELRSIIQDMDVTIRQRFKESFDAVVENFEKVFEDLFGGGHAKLTLEDPANPLETPIVIEAQPPGKKLQNITLLSGGEKTMTAIALMFAVLKAKPTPFCILDEVEAALDDTNIDCFARYLRRFEKTQFALVTHQKATMEYADVLYGVTMPEAGITKILSLKLGESL